MAPRKKTQDESAVSNDDLKADLKELGTLLKDHFTSAWNSKQRKEAEKQINKGVHSSIRAIKSIIEDAREGDLGEKVKRGLHKALKKSNSELHKAKKVWKPKTSASAKKKSTTRKTTKKK